MLADLRKLLAEATPGSWQSMEAWERLEGENRLILSPENVALIVAAVNALPALLDVVEAAREVVDTKWVHDDDVRGLRAALDALEAPI